MDIFNGEFVKGAVDGINDIIKGFNKLGKISSILNLGSLIGAVKVLGTLFVSSFSSSFSQISAAWKGTLSQMTKDTKQESIVASQGWKNGWGSVNQEGKLSIRGQKVATAGMLAGSALTVAGSAVAANDQTTGAWLSASGNALSIGSQLALINPILGVIGGTVAGLVTLLTSLPSELEKAQQEAEKAAQKAEEANIERAKKQERAKTLDTELDKLKRLEESQWDSVEAQQAYIDAQNSLTENYPELISSYDEAGNAIINLQNAEAQLAAIRQKGSAAALEATNAEIDSKNAELAAIWTKQWEVGSHLNITSGSDSNVESFLGPLAEYSFGTTADQIGFGDTRLNTKYNDFRNKYKNYTLDEITFALENDYSELIEPLFDSIEAYQQYIADIVNTEDYGTYISERDKNISQSKQLQKELKNQEKVRVGRVAELTLDDWAIENQKYAGYASEFTSAIPTIQKAVSSIILDEEGNYSQYLLKSLKEGESLYKEGSTELSDAALNIIKRLTNGIATSLESTYSDIEAEGKTTEFEEFISQAELGKFSESYIQTTLEDYANGNNAFFTLYNERIQNSLEKQKENFRNYAKDKNRIIDLDDESLLGDTDKEINEFINKIPINLLTNLRTITNRIEGQIKDNKISSEMGTSFVEEYVNFLKEVSNSGIDSAQKEEIYSLLNEADLTNVFGIYEFIDSLNKAGYSDLANKFPAVELIDNSLINVTTEYQNFLSLLASNTDKVKEAIQKAAEGVDSMSEAVEMANDLKIDFGDLTFENGKFYYRDIGTIKENLEKTYTDQLDALYGEDSVFSQQIAAANELSFVTKEGFEKIDYTEAIKAMETAESLTSDQQADLDSFIKQQQVLDQFRQSYLDSLKDTDTEPTKEGFIAYLEAEKARLMEAGEQLAAKYAEYIAQSTELTNIENDIKSQLQGDFLTEYRQEVGNSLNKLSGYTVDEVSKIAAAFGEDKAGLFIKQSDGTYTTTLDNIKKIFNGTRQDIVTELVYSIEADLESLIESMGSLGEEIGSEGKKLTSRDLYDTLSPTLGDLGSQAAWDALLVLFQKNNQQGFIDVMGRIKGYTPEQSIALWDEFSRGFQRGTDEYAKTLFESKIKLLTGEMSKSEVDSMSTSDLRTELDNFIKSFDDFTSLTLQQRLKLIEDYYSSNDEALKNLSAGEKLKQQIADQEKVLETYSQEDEDFVNRQAIDEAAKILRETGGKNLTEDQAAKILSVAKEANAVLGETGYNITGTVSGELADAYKYYSDTIAENATKGAQELLTSMVEGALTGTQIQDYFRQYDIEIDYKKAQDLANGTIDALLESIITELASENIDISSKMEEVMAVIIDAILNSISSGISSLGSGIEGTLGAADYQALVTKYGLSGNAIRTSRGLQLSTSDQQTIISSLYSNAREAGLQAEFGEQFWEVWRDSENIAIEGYTDIEEAIANCYDEQGNLVGVTQDYVEALQQARAAAMFDENAMEFAFMEQDATDGQTKNFDRFVSNIDMVKSSLEGLRETGEMGYNDFFNIIDYIGNSGQWDKVSTQLGIGGTSIEEFALKVASATETIGKVDAAAFASLGIDISTAATAMADGMQEGLKETAQQQIKFLSGLEQMLEALAMLEALGQIKSGFSFSFDVNGDGTPEAINNFTDFVDYYNNLANDTKKQAEYVMAWKLAIEGQYGEAGTQLFNAIFGDGDGMDFFEAGMLKYFGGKDQDWINKEGQAIISKLKDLTQGTAESVGTALAEMFGDGGAWEQYFTYDENGLIAGFKEGAELPFFQAFERYLTSGEPFQGLKDINYAKVSAALAKSGKKDPIAIEGVNYSVAVKDGKINIVDNKKKEPVSVPEDQLASYTENVKKALEQEVGEQITSLTIDPTSGEVIDIDWSGLSLNGEPILDAGEVPVNINPQLKAEVSGEAVNELAGKIEEAITNSDKSISPKISVEPILELPQGNSAITSFINEIIALLEKQPLTPNLKADGEISPGEALLASALAVISTLEGNINKEKVDVSVNADGKIANSDKLIEILKNSLPQELSIPNVPITVNGTPTKGTLSPLEAFTEADLVKDEEGFKITGVNITVDGQPVKGEITLTDFLESVKTYISSQKVTGVDNTVDSTIILGTINGIANFIEKLKAGIPDSTEKEVTINLKPRYNDSSISGMNAKTFSDYVQGLIDSGEPINQEYLSSLGQKFQALESAGVGFEGGFDTEEQWSQTYNNIRTLSAQVTVDGEQAQAEIEKAAEGAKVEVEVEPKEPIESPEPQEPIEVTVNQIGAEETTALLDEVKAAEDKVENSDPNVSVTESGGKFVIEQLTPVNEIARSIPDVNISVSVSGVEEAKAKLNSLKNQTISSAWTGMANHIVPSGRALAEGSFNRLYAGAQLANKTLVGELGPELAVYDGQYHLLGSTGAEFVKLPEDALVFNHLQTRGIINGQMNGARAKVYSGRAQNTIERMTGSAMVAGNVTGPAAASGIGDALAAVRRAKAIWQGLLNSLSAADLLGAGGGGGGGGGGDDNSLKAHIEDLQEWYNLSRQIAQLEQQINTLLAERENITDGHKYLQNLRETQSLLEDQVNTQSDLLKFQQLQLEAQADFINDHEIWSQFLEVDESGLLQYREGNETNGGKGALEVLQDLNEMSGDEQLNFIKNLGYSARNNEGEELEGEELIAKFYEDLQKQIDDYDALMDTVNETEAALEELETQINEIEQEIRQNEIDLSQDIYDIIVKSWEENIKQLKEQNDLIKEANDAYADSIQKAIDTERNIYEQNQAIADREQLQRQLSLLRRSGGSASEIADLEQQLNDTLKDEYFQKQEEALETIRDANERQVELMEQQVKLQEDALAYEQENGVIWSKTFDVMLGNDAQILDFMQGHSTEFFEKSYLEQEDMLLEWAKMVGIYNEDKAYDYYTEQGEKKFENIWKSKEAKKWESYYKKIDSTKQEQLKREYLDRYASSLLDGAKESEAMAEAQKHFIEHLENYKKAQDAAKRDNKKKPTGNNNNGNSSSSSGGNNSGSRTNNNKKTYQQKQQYNPPDMKKGIEVITDNGKIGSGKTLKEAVNGVKTSLGENNKVREIRYKNGSGRITSFITPYSNGGIVDFTGPAMVHGSKSKPEGFLNAEQMSILREGLDIAGKADSIKNSLTEMFTEILQASTKPLRSYVKAEPNNSISIAPGAITIQVQELNDKYDIDNVANDVMDKMYSIASRATSRGVSRR